MFGRIRPARCFAVLTSSFAASAVWAQPKRVGPEVLYEKSGSEGSQTGGRTAICFVDGREEANLALREAIRGKESQDKLIVAYFVDSEGPMLFDFPASIVQTSEGTAAIAAMKERIYGEAKHLTLGYKSILEASGLSNVELLLVPCDHPQASAAKFANDLGAEIVYVGSHNKGVLARAIIGSFSDYLLHHVEGSVCVARFIPPKVAAVDTAGSIDGFLVVGPSSLT